MARSNEKKALDQQIEHPLRLSRFSWRFAATRIRARSQAQALLRARALPGAPQHLDSQHHML